MILSFWGCSNDKDFGGLENIGWNEKPLQITTRILTTKSTNFIQEFKEGSMLGLQITSGTVDDLYNGISTYKNVSVKAYRVNGKIRWQQSPEVILDSNEATIYAYYPYQEDINFNARQIPVKLAPNALETDDYMYGTHAIGQKAVNSTSPLVLLSMNHALSLISFQLNLSKGKTGAFIISSVQIGNKPGGTTLVSEGTLDITTGDIIGSTARSTSASTVLSLTNPVTLINEKYCDPMRLMVIPPSGTIGTGDVETLFTINGETYKFDIPANTQWEKGKKYLYKLSFNGRSLQLRDVSITDWLPGNDEGLIGNIMKFFMLWLLRCNAVASFDPFATGNYTENNNWLYHSGELDHRRHYPYDVFFIQPTLYILSIRETTGLVQIPFYIQGLSFPLNLSPKTLFYLTITRTRPV